MHHKLAESLGGTTTAPLEENETSHRGFREKSLAAKAGSWGAGWGEGCPHITGELGAVLAAHGRKAAEEIALQATAGAGILKATGIGGASCGSWI